MAGLTDAWSAKGRKSLCEREYHLFNYYGDPEATDVIIAMGAVSGAAREVVRALCAAGRKMGFVQVHLYRPFSAAHLKKALPETVRRIAVLDRCKSMGAVGEPLYEDVRSALYGEAVTVVGGRCGLSSKDTQGHTTVNDMQGALAISFTVVL